MNTKIDEFFGIPASELSKEKLLRRTLRCINIRTTHSGYFPVWLKNTPDSNLLQTLLEQHGLEVLESAEETLRAKQFQGREYTFHWHRERETWRYEVSHDPQRGLQETHVTRSRMATLFDDVEESKEACPKSVWWDGKRILDGKFLAFDLETALKWPGEYPPIVLGSAATETGDAVLFTPSQIVDFFVKHHSANPKQIWCGWNIAEFDLPTLDYRIPGFREIVHEIFVEKLINGYAYDTLKFVQLLDIGVYGDTFNRESKEMYPVWWGEGWGRKVYALGPQAKRWLGIELPKEEQTTFWSFLDNPQDISSDQAAYALADAYITAKIQEILYYHPATRKLARKASRNLTAFDGVLLENPNSDIHSDLLIESNCKFGWQTHTIQFLGAYSLSWISENGIMSDVDYIFNLIDELESDLQSLLDRLNGVPGYLITETNKKNNKAREYKWVRGEGVEIDKLIKELNDKGETDGLTYSASGLEAIEHYSPLGKKYTFVEGRSVKEKPVLEYIEFNLWPNLPRSSTKGHDFTRMGRQQKEWMYFFNVSRIEEIPDTVLRLNFQIAAVLKKIATVKTYIPGVCAKGKKQKAKLQKLRPKELRHKLNLENVKKARLHPSFRALLATGRTGAFDPNPQQVERNNKYRGCFCALDGRKIMSNDYGAAEMGTQGEIYVRRYGRRTLVQFMNDGFDVHLLTAMQFRFPKRRSDWFPILNHPVARDMKRVTTWEEKEKLAAKLEAEFDWFKADLAESGEDIAKTLWVNWLAKELLSELPIDVAKKEIKDARQAAKPVNFGVPGGMLPPKILQLAKTDYGLTDMTLEQAETAYKAWLEMYPEGREWLRDGKQYLIKQPPFPFDPYYDNCITLTGRLRGYRKKGISEEHDVGLNEWHNTQFQGLAADAAKIALYLTWREGLIQVNFVHDEIDFEATEALVDEHQQISADRMRLGMDNVVKDINITVGSSVGDRWQK